MNDDIEDIDTDEPQEGDYVMESCGRLGCRVSVGEFGGRHLGEFADREEAEDFIRRDMDKGQFYPGVWYVSDHGNWESVAI